MATKNICTYPLEQALGKEANAIIEQNGKLKRVNLDWEFDKKASAIVSEADGEVIVVSDSSMARPKNLILFGKTEQESTSGHQLFNAGYCEGVGSNATLTVSDDEYTITATGGVSAGYGFSKFPLDSNKCVGKTVFMKVDSLTGGTGSGVMLYGFKGGANALSYTLKQGNKFIECAIPEDIEEVKVYVYTNTTGIVFTEENTVIVKGLMVTYDKDAAWEKYTGGNPAPNPDYPQEIVSAENPEIMVCGKNFLPYPYLHKTVTKNGATFTAQDDGGIAGSGTPTDYADMWIYNGDPMAKHGVVSFSLQGTFQNIAGSMALYDENDNSLVSRSVYYSNKPITIDLDDYPNATRWLVLLKRSEANVEMSGVVYPQIEIGETSEYEKFKTPQTIPLTHTLHGIPVKTGGNYTDRDGQQWICDEIDLERGVLVQRVKELVLNGSENWGTSGSTYLYLDLEEHATKGGEGFCSHFDYWYNYGGDCVFATEKWLYLGKVVSDKYGLNVAAWKEFLASNNVTICYVLAEPIETLLTDAEIYAFKHTEMNYPNTTIINDAGSFMKLDYFADTKKFVKNYLKENGMSVHSPARISEVSLPASGWVGSASPYSQVVKIDGVTENSQVDLTPSVAQLAVFYEKDLGFVTENVNGVVTVYAIGQKPSNDYIIQVTLTEVDYE